ncbi:MAG: hypothetical protein WBC19_07225 [Pyrinomonadaceae bacterium]
MRSLILYLTAAVLLFAFTAILSAQTPPEQLQQMVAQLQKTPADNALREKIIKLAVTMKPAPEIPEDARRPFIRGNTAIKNASSAEDYANAAKLYQDALLLAPWWADAYFNLAKGQELHKDFDAAIQSLKFFLMTSPSAADAREAQDHIYALEELRDKKAVSDKANSPEAKAARDQENAKKELTDFLRSLDGAVFVESWEIFGGDYRRRAKVKIRGGELAFGHDAVNANGGHIFGPETALGEQFSTLTQVVKIDSRDISLGKTACPKGERDVKISIDKTGRSLTLTSCDVSILYRQ